MLHRRLAQNRAGVVHQDIDLGEIGIHFSNEFVQRFTVAEVAGVAFELAPHRGNGLFNRAARRFERCAHADNVRARFGKRLSHCRADSAPASRDERDFPIQLESIENTHSQVTSTFITSPPFSICSRPVCRLSSG